MKHLLSILCLFALFFSSACDDDDEVGIFLIGRADGWRVASVESNYQAQASAAIAALTEAEVTATGQSRQELEDLFDVFVARETLVEDCDRDDLVFFLDNGQIRIIKGNAVCPDIGDPNVLMDFNDNFYAANSNGSAMTLRSPDGVTLGEYSIDELSSDRFVITTNRSAPAPLEDAFTYFVTYTLTGN